MAANKQSFICALERYDDTRVYQLHLTVPNEIASEFVAKKQSRVICSVNNSLHFHAALLPKNGLYHILMNQANCKKLGVTAGDTLEVVLEPDTSKYGMPLPQEIENLLEADSLFHQYFEGLTPGKQRNLLHIVNQVKSTRSRETKAQAICDHLTEAKGKLDFKALNDKIKAYNNL